MNQSLSRPTTISYALLILLLLATPALLVWQRYGMIRTIEISPSQPHGARITDDRFELHGNSVGTLVRTRDAITMRCALGAAATYRFCKMQFLLGRPGRGIDLSRFDTIEFDLRYSGRPPRLVKLHLMNFEPEFSKPGDWNSQRFNEAVIDVPLQSPFTIPMNVLRTADWWSSTHNIPLSKTYARLDRVTAVELSTGAVSPGQTITLEVRSIRFHGKWISKTALLMGLVFLIAYFKASSQMSDAQEAMRQFGDSAEYQEMARNMASEARKQMWGAFSFGFGLYLSALAGAAAAG